MTRLVASRPAMGTVFECVFVDPGNADLRAVSEHAFAEIKRLEERYSLYQPTSQLSRLNRLAPSQSVRLDGEFLNLLLRIHSLWRETDGALDPTVGRLMELWGFHDDNRAPPDPAQISAGLATSGFDQVLIDSKDRSVRFRSDGVRLDFGAFGKGYALDLAVEQCRLAGVESGLLHAGTSTVSAWGSPEPGLGWRVGIPTPDAGRAGVSALEVDEGAPGASLLGTVELENAALSVSAVWGRATIQGAPGWGHILDPRTGYPVCGTEMAVVIAPSAFEADALSTALVVGGAPLQERLASRRAGWRSLIVSRGVQDGTLRVVDCGLLRPHD